MQLFIIGYFPFCDFIGYIYKPCVFFRFHSLKTNLRVRSAALRNALTDFGPSSEHFLNQSVELPWQRAISKTNQLPYYIEWVILEEED